MSATLFFVKFEVGAVDGVISTHIHVFPYCDLRRWVGEVSRGEWCHEEGGARGFLVDG